VAYSDCLAGAAAARSVSSWWTGFRVGVLGDPTVSKHPWTPGGSKGARGLLSVPYRSPVVSIVPACSPDGSTTGDDPSVKEATGAPLEERNLWIAAISNE
jgi:hypothetical protein